MTEKSKGLVMTNTVYASVNFVLDVGNICQLQSYSWPILDQIVKIQNSVDLNDSLVL